MHLVRHELRILLRPLVTRALLLFYLVLCVLATVNGAVNLKKSAAEYDLIEQRFDQQQQRLGKKLQQSEDRVDAVGSLAYYAFMPTRHDASGWSALFPGQRADYNNTLRVRLLAIQGQMNDSELQNYHHAQMNQLSLGFIWVYLLPLLIGVLVVNIVADDREAGRWPLIASSSRSMTQVILVRLGIRFGLLLLLNTGVLAFACWLLHLVNPIEIAAVTVLLLLYHLVWFVLAGLIISGRKTRRQNLVYYCTIWTVLVFLLPGFAYLSRMDSGELELAIDAVVKQREFMNNSWDKPKQPAMDAFILDNPEWSGTTPLPEGFHWKWYYAMQQHSDQVAASAVHAYREKRLSHYQLGRLWSLASPAMGLQLALQRIAGTDALAYQHYLDRIVEYHRELQRFYFPSLFLTGKAENFNLDQLSRFTYEAGEVNRVVVQSGAVMLLFFLVVCGVVTSRWQNIR